MRRYWMGAALLLVGGCSSGGGATTATASPTPDGAPWVVVSSGSATPSPGPPVGAGGTPSRWPTGFLPLPSGATTVTPAPTASCVPDSARGTINGADVKASSTSAAVTFYNPGGQYLVEYRVTAISQDLVDGPQRDVGWTVITPGATCGYLTATVTGLDPRTRYVFSVDEVTRRIGKDGTQASTVARSGVVSTT